MIETLAGQSLIDSARRWAGFAYQALSDRNAAPPDVPLPAPLLSRLGLGPLLYHALSSREDDRAHPFLVEFRHATTANLLRMAHARRLRDRLQAEGIRAVLLKGAATLVRFGDDPGLRPMADLDLLVTRADVPRAAELLRAGGLTEREEYPRTTRRRHSVSFVRTTGPFDLDVDLHQGLAPWPLATALPGLILGHHDEVDGWRIPRPLDAICVTAVHRANSGFTGGCSDLVDLLRLARLLDGAGWVDLVETSARAGVAGAVYASLRQADWWLAGSSSESADGLATLGRRLGPARRALLDRLVPGDLPVRRRPLLTGPLGRNLLVVPCATQGLRGLVAAARIAPFRLTDEWQRQGAPGVGRSGALGQVLARLLYGALPPAPPPPPPDARRPA
jgi:hypothetical protein